MKDLLKIFIKFLVKNLRFKSHVVPPFLFLSFLLFPFYQPLVIYLFQKKRPIKSGVLFHGFLQNYPREACF